MNKFWFPNIVPLSLNIQHNPKPNQVDTCWFCRPFYIILFTKRVLHDGSDAIGMGQLVIFHRVFKGKIQNQIFIYYR